VPLQVHAVRRYAAGADAGEGLFVRGRVDPGEIVAVYPGVTYALEVGAYNRSLYRLT
jgi:hypothetical protein